MLRARCAPHAASRRRCGPDGCVARGAAHAGRRALLDGCPRARPCWPIRCGACVRAMKGVNTNKARAGKLAGHVPNIGKPTASGDMRVRTGRQESSRVVRNSAPTSLCPHAGVALLFSPHRPQTSWFMVGCERLAKSSAIQPTPFTRGPPASMQTCGNSSRNKHPIALPLILPLLLCIYTRRRLAGPTTKLDWPGNQAHCRWRPGRPKSAPPPPELMSGRSSVAVAMRRAEAWGWPRARTQAMSRRRVPES